MHKIIGSSQKPIIIVDWSGLTYCGKYHFLRAAVPVNGRALPILEMPFKEKDYGSQNAHKIFLEQLKEILPRNCHPIILTDAGFRNSWFKLVSSFNWDYIGRIRHTTLCSKIQDGVWISTKSLYSIAKRTAQHLGCYLLTKSNSLRVNFYLFKEENKNGVRKNLRGKKIQCSVSLKHAKREGEPWLLGTSLASTSHKAHEIVNIYKKRMQIEEGFRDLKNERAGLSFRQIRSESLGRLSVALLIGALTMFLLWIIGLAAKRKKLHYQYQANTIRHRNVLSNFIIGWQVLEEKKYKFSKTDINHAVRSL